MIRFASRLVLPLFLILSVLAFFSMFLGEKLTYSWFKKDLDARSRFTSSLVIPNIIRQVRAGRYPELSTMFERFTVDERLFALGLCGAGGEIVAQSAHYPMSIGCPPVGQEAAPKTIEINGGEVHVAGFPVFEAGGKAIGHLMVVQDLSYANRRSQETRYYIFLSFMVLIVAVSAISLTIGYMNYRRWLSGLRFAFTQPGAVLQGKDGIPSELLPVLSHLRSLISEIDIARKAEAGLRLTWSSETIRGILSSSLLGQQVIVVSNREPYSHTRQGDAVKVEKPASGVVTALDPVLRACAGTWIAHGSGNADREFVDERDSLLVPPDENLYKLRRIWLDKQELAGYYDGFSNEGLWPLCLIAHVRPIFRANDWQAYVNVNRKFADAIVEESVRDDPVILVQDYHFSLLPSLVRERLPKATIVTFWHIPWPNPESFGICPWRNEILRGLLGSSIIGFHTHYHANNFLATVDRFLESQIDREHHSIRRGGRTTLVRGYPISIAWPSGGAAATDSAAARDLVFTRHGIPPQHKVFIGVDRMDYTKGIQERLLAFQELLKKNPGLVGQCSFIQIASPTRETLGGYRRYAEDTIELAEKINQRFATPEWTPIHFLHQNFPPSEVSIYLKAADVCVVTSLHDGMNLVAKEFVSSRNDETGVLILSMFTGASQELPEALLVNPYSLDQIREAYAAALAMPLEEQKHRMRSMRNQVRDFNVFRWAGRILLDAADTRHRDTIVELSNQRFG